MKMLVFDSAHGGRELLNVALKSTLSSSCRYFVGTRDPEKHEGKVHFLGGVRRKPEQCLPRSVASN